MFNTFGNLYEWVLFAKYNFHYHLLLWCNNTLAQPSQAGYVLSIYNNDINNHALEEKKNFYILQVFFLIEVC